MQLEINGPLFCAMLASFEDMKFTPTFKKWTDGRVAVCEMLAV